MMFNVRLMDLRRVKTRQDIPTLLNRMQAENICEVGVREGIHFNSLLSAKHIKKAVAVDIWRNTGVHSQNDNQLNQNELDRLYYKMKHQELTDSRIQVIKDFSLQAVTQFKNNYFDFIYIDAEHTEEAVYKDLCAWWSKVRVGGVLAGHDYAEASHTYPDGTIVKFGIIPAVTRFIAEKQLVLHVDKDLPWRNWFIPKLI